MGTKAGELWSRQAVRTLVDADSGLQNARVYTSPDVHERELERIFGRSWLCLGHESQLQKPGDYTTTYMGEDSILVTRHRDGSIHAFLNQCRHRGNKLCRGDYGNAPSFTCSYHGWCYGGDGKLLGMPHENSEGYYGEFDKTDWGLVEVPRVESYKGLLFGNWDEHATPLIDHLGEATWYLDAFLDRTEAGTEVIALHKWRVRSNWKVGAEQHASDFYHASCSHVSYSEAINPGASINRLIPEPLPMEFGLQYSSPKLGHGAGWMSFPDEPSMHEAIHTNEPEVVAWLRGEGGELHRERLGETRSEKMSIFHMTIFPNLSLNRGQGYLRLWQPRGQHETEVWNFLLVNKDDPREVKDGWKRAFANIFSAAGVLEQDDSENSMTIGMGLRGWKGRQSKLNFAMGVGHTEQHRANPVHEEGFEGPGNISFVYSEEGLRGFYRRWTDLMVDDQ